MGDRTTVELMVQNQDADRTVAIIAAEGDAASYDTQDDTFTTLTFDEVNYGTLRFLDKLEKAGIPYDSNWGDGDEYGSGSTHLRFNAEGDPVKKEVYDEAVNPDLKVLMQLADDDGPDALENVRTYLRTHNAKVCYPEWDNQVEYAKLYRTKRLIQS